MEVSQYEERFKSELDSVMRFWTTFSHDLKHGGFYCCLSRSGEVYDTIKYSWMLGRQVWMYCKLYNTLPDYHTSEILDAAIKGGEFLLSWVKVVGNERCYFATTEDGKPVKVQRKPYAECFYVMGLAELFRATGDQRYQLAAESMVSQLIYWIRIDDSGLGMIKLAGNPPSQELGRPMMLLNVLTEFCGPDKTLREKYQADFDWAVQAILKHSDGQWVRENIGPDGTTLPGCQGRLTIPGHALEAGWFLLQEAATRGDDQLRDVAIKQFIDLPFNYGQDGRNMSGGLFYFLDTSGHDPVQLEWSMKLWWVHCEAMIACLMAYHSTREKRHWDNFKQLCEYTFNMFSDPEGDEWFGYLTRQGGLNQSFKGGPYKGCFHVPRCLLICLQLLKQLGESPIN